MAEAPINLYLVISNLHSNKFNLREIYVAEETLEDMRQTLIEAYASGYIGGVRMELEDNGITKEELVLDIWTELRYPQDMGGGPATRGAN